MTSAPTDRAARRRTVAVIMGGASGEHSISLRSAAAVCDALTAGGHEVRVLGITRAGDWRTGDFSGLLERGRTGLVEIDDTAGLPVTLARTPAGIETVTLDRGTSSAQGVIDCVFPIVHGPGGEDGSLQGFLELLGVPFVGAGCRASAIAMDKIATKVLCAGAGIAQVDFIDATDRTPKQVRSDLEGTFGYPCFVKPSALGSSVGISKVCGPDELQSALDEARRWDRRVIIEQGRDVREIELALLGEDEPAFSIAGEIIIPGGFYDFDSKYVGDNAELVAGAELEPAQLEAMKHIARKYWSLIGCSGMARADFFIDRATGEVLFNEFNTIPGFTPISMYPRLWRESGIELDSLVSRLVDLALLSATPAESRRAATA